MRKLLPLLLTIHLLLIIPLLLLIPLLSPAQQPVKPIVSPDYISLIQNDSVAPKKTATVSPPDPLRIKRPYPDLRIKSIKEKNSILTILPATTKFLTLGGNYSISAGESSVNPNTPDIFKTGQLITHSISIQANIKRDYWPILWAFSLKASQNTETMVIPDNRNTSRNLAVSLQRNIKQFSIKGSYDYFDSRFSNDNSTGFLNQAYQQTLLTQNPWLLLKDNGHFAHRTQQTGHLSVEKKQGNLTAGLTNTIEAVDDNSNMSLKPDSTVLIYTRKQNDNHYTSNAWLGYFFAHNNSTYDIRLNYIFNDERVNMSYPASLYHYHRTTSDASATVAYTISEGYFAAGLNAGNKFYGSTTTLNDKFFLPELSGFLSARNLFFAGSNTKLTAAYTSFCSETPINRSFAPYMLTQLTPQAAAWFAPTTEVQTYNNLSPMQHREFTTGIQLEYSYAVTLHADYSIRDTKDNIFPVYANNQLILKNLADTRYKGLELQVKLQSLHRHPRTIATTNTISFYKYSNIVTRVQDGYNNLPLAGFSTVYKSLIKGQPVGVIVGTSNHRNALTLLNNQQSVIGDPTPDFTLKFAHTANWKAFNINLDWEYRKGGDIWNGTAATLDHYTGPSSSYIQKGDNLRIHTLSLAYDIKTRKYLQKITLMAYAHNLLLWSAYKGVDPNQLLFDQAATTGLDFFNLPSTNTYGLSASFQF